MAGSGNTQIINGGSYVMYSPEWYAARQAEAQRATVAQGTAQGAALKAAADAAGTPLTGSSSSSTSSSTGSASGSSTPYTPPPSIAGLTAAAAGTPQAPSSGGGGSYAPAAHLAPVDTSAAEAASFNRAKDQVGEEASGALTGLRSALAGRNLLGGGLESLATAQTATGAARELGDVTRQQAVTRADEAQKNAATNFSGDITQRGQDIQREEAANSLAGDLAKTTYEGQIQQRGQDIQAINAAKALEIEQAQLGAQQRSTALAGLTAALRVTSNSDLAY